MINLRLFLFPAAVVSMCLFMACRNNSSCSHALLLQGDRLHRTEQKLVQRKTDMNVHLTQARRRHRGVPHSFEDVLRVAP